MSQLCGLNGLNGEIQKSRDVENCRGSYLLGVASVPTGTGGAWVYFDAYQAAMLHSLATWEHWLAAC